MTPSMHEILWKISPKHTKNIPGILPLCIGMPVMIKHNEATELSVTNGQEANVVGWTSDTDDDDRNYLQTLFVKLISPIQEVYLPDLPVNVVPITKSTLTIPVTFPNGDIKSIKRTQVQVILNFSMTDYNSQG